MIHAVLAERPRQHDEPDFASDIRPVGFRFSAGTRATGGLPEGGAQDASSPAAGATGGDTAGVTSAAEGWSKAGSPVAGSDFVCELPDLRTLVP